MDWVGYIEGAAEALSYFMKLFSGMLSDFFLSRKPLMVFGYTLIVTSRVILGICSTFFPIISARLMERFGNGVQSTPRDTLVADVTPPNSIGAAYGIKRTLAQAGSFFGGILGILAMWWTCDNFQQVFQLATIPAVFAFLVLIFLVKEPKRSYHSAVSSEIPLPQTKKRQKIQFSNFPLLGRSFWLLMIITVVFMLARFDEAFLMIHAKDTFGTELKYLPIITMTYNASWCLVSYPVGLLGDRLNRYWLLAIGIVFLIVSNMFLAVAHSFSLMLVGVFFWGIQYGITLNIFLSIIAEIVPTNLRGTAFGVFYIICAILSLCANGLFGQLAHHYGNIYGFLTSGAIGALALVLLLGIKGAKRSRH
jgi:MFS family permease